VKPDGQAASQEDNKEEDPLISVDIILKSGSMLNKEYINSDNGSSIAAYEGTPLKKRKGRRTNSISASAS